MFFVIDSFRYATMWNFNYRSNGIPASLEVQHHCQCIGPQTKPLDWYVL